jgi:6-phospho-beta-glucosidase
MNKGIQVCVVGAGSSYTPELIQGLLNLSEERLPVRSIRLQDPDAKRLETMAGLAARMIAKAGRQIELKQGPALEPLLEGADFVITQIRVGGMAARHLDESIPLNYGILGQETTGPGGLFKALRTIPPMLAIAETVAKAAPQALILNYTNPSGIITEAVCRYTSAKLIGLCAGIPSIQVDLAAKLKDVYPDLRTYSIGLNHLGFVHKFVSGGQDVTQAALERLYPLNGKADAEAALVRRLGAVPIGYLNYFYHRKERLEHALRAPETRAQAVQKLEAQILSEAAQPGTDSKPQALESRGGGGYSDITFGFMDAIYNNTNVELTCSQPNGSSTEGIDPEAVLEITCRVGRHGATPIPCGRIPLAFRGLVQTVKAFETLAVEAAVKKERRLVVQALMNHPLAGDLDMIEPLVDEMLKAHHLDYR